MADPYRPNEGLTRYLTNPGPVANFLVTAIGVFLGWWFLRQSLFVLVDEPTAWGMNRLGFALNLLFFAALVALTARAARVMHGIDWRRFLGSADRLAPDFIQVFAACVAIYAIIIGMGWDASTATMRPLTGWILTLPIMLICILIQTGAEEFFYRGYLHHFCTVYLKRPLLWLFVPSLIFGASHVFNDVTSVSTALAYVLWTTAFGVASVDLTARTGSIGAAWGLHMAVNTAALMIAASDGAPLSGAALYLFPERAFDYAPNTAEIWIALVFELLFLAVLWLAARNAVRR